PAAEGVAGVGLEHQGLARHHAGARGVVWDPDAQGAGPGVTADRIPLRRAAAGGSMVQEGWRGKVTGASRRGPSEGGAASAAASGATTAASGFAFGAASRRSSTSSLTIFLGAGAPPQPKTSSSQARRLTGTPPGTWAARC